MVRRARRCNQPVDVLVRMRLLSDAEQWIPREDEPRILGWRLKMADPRRAIQRPTVVARPVLRRNARVPLLHCRRFSVARCQTAGAKHSGLAGKASLAQVDMVVRVRYDAMDRASRAEAATMQITGDDSHCAF